MRIGRRAVLRYAGLTGVAGLMGDALGMPALPPMAKTRAGMVSGYVAGRVVGFKGIPYGADTRTTRFQAPKAVVAWTGVKACTEWGARAPQQQADRKGVGQVEAGFRALEGATEHYHLPSDEGAQSEDCLHVNVWTPRLADGKKRAVLFYIHGGAYNNGTGNAALYDGERLAERGDVVVVSVNHRLNAFGFLYLAEMAGLESKYKDSGNVGMMDLVLALEWVRDNIAEFGGDPGRVTIFGQSGGGAKCATLMAMPSAKGLFHRVLTMSGQQVWAAPKGLSAKRAEAALAAMGVTGEVTAEKLDALTVEQIQLGARTTGNWLPVRDDAVLYRDPFCTRRSEDECGRADDSGEYEGRDSGVHGVAAGGADLGDAAGGVGEGDCGVPGAVLGGGDCCGLSRVVSGDEAGGRVCRGDGGVPELAGAGAGGRPASDGCGECEAYVGVSDRLCFADGGWTGSAHDRPGVCV